jgi:hypothetical protein
VERDREWSEGVSRKPGRQEGDANYVGRPAGIATALKSAGLHKGWRVFLLWCSRMLKGAGRAVANMSRVQKA